MKYALRKAAEGYDKSTKIFLANMTFRNNNNILVAEWQDRIIALVAIVDSNLIFIKNLYYNNFVYEELIKVESSWIEIDSCFFVNFNFHPATSQIYYFWMFYFVISEINIRQ